MPFDRERLTEARRAAGLSREQLAVAIDRGYSAIVNYEQGRTTPPAEYLERIADQLGVEVGELFTR